ncbi:MAG: Stp1/IreP family PP2C-type Ser/Thr phosphatase [Bdellovibrionaceae bacterium]|nr:Stp1/IreP family PP2C-type Ser/Thr phosphatase [Pseudobdellovibrionaceae bacterium]
MKMEAWFLTDKGHRRDSNQDACLINKDIGVFIVADGMGGHFGGEVASAIAVQTVEDTFKRPGSKEMAPREVLTRAFEEASRRIFDKAATENPELAGMGTTMVMAFIRGKHIYIANVGDSRCYLFKKPHLWQITEDHSLLNEQIRAGVLKEENIGQFVARNVITRSVGYEREVHPDIIEREILAGESYLLCSDGLSGLVSDQKISQILNQNSPDRAVKACVDQALENGGDDNVTVLILHFYE